LACGSSTDQGDAGNNPDGGTSSDGSPQNDGAAGNDSGTKNDGSTGNDSGTTTGKVVFVIPMENKAQTQIYGNATDAPYINNTLMVAYPHTTMFTDELPTLDSEPHYIWMEAGTNALGDHTFGNDSDPSSSNSTNNTAHLSTTLDAAKVSWMSYQEDITAGTCPVASIVNTKSFYAAKHNPFVFFQDVVGKTPDPKNAYCIAHHKPGSQLAADIKNNAVAQFNFVTPNLCNDMHGDGNCSHADNDAANIKAGDDWLKANLQPMIDYAIAHDGYVFLTWDEGDSTNLIPFIAIGKHAIPKKPGAVKYTHSSLNKSIAEVFGVTPLSTVASATDFADLFDPGTFP
jgi:acid phosphatase